MSKPIIEVKGISKRYKLGTIGASTMRDEVEAFFARFKKPKSLDNLNSEILKTEKLKTANSPAGASEFWALRDVSFDVQPGEVVGIIGRNGAGKSTLLKILSRITEPTSGEIRVRGRIASLLEVGTGFHPELSGRENIFLNGAILGMTKAEIRAKFDEIVDFAGVEQFIDTPVKRYSSGMYVRLAFAVAAHLEPEILIVDEVLAVGDAEFQKKCLGKMKDVAGHGRTILFVSHNMPTVVNLCGKCIFLENGQLVTSGFTKDVVQGYLAKNIQKKSTPLRDRLDRSGSGHLRFTNTWVEHARGGQAGAFLSADDIRIVAEYELNGPKNLADCLFAFALYDESGYQLSDPSNFSTGQTSLGTLPRRGRVSCLLPKLPLRSGKFIYNLIARESNRDVLDFIEEAGSFEVEPGDFFGTGRTIEDNQGKILFNQSWSLEE
jgi:lipopolysaccharide transport system ATP-binding protein